MRLALVFIFAACSGAAPTTPPHVPAPRPPPPPPDAAVIDAPPPLALRGDACSEAVPCGADLTCAAAPGGYCLSACGATGTACPDGTCVATLRTGEQCMKTCRTDGDCRAAEGYTCDRAWHACMLPNAAVIVPNQCPVPPGPARDAAFGAAVALSSAETPGVAQRAPSAAITNAGELVVMFDSHGELGGAIVTARGVQPVSFPAGAGDRAGVQIARDAKGILYAVWLAAEGQHREVLLARSRDGGKTWTGPDRVDAAECTDPREPACLDRPMIAIGAASPSTGNDLVYVMYAAGGGLRVATSHDEGNTFRAPITAVPGHHGGATVGADGRLHIVVLDPATSLPGFGSADQRILYTVSTDNGATYAKAQTLSGRDELLPFYAAAPAVAVDTRRGITYAAYVRGGRDAAWDIVVLASKDKGKTWKRTRIGDVSCATEMVPSLALDPTTGVLHVAWYDSRLGFAHATCPPGAATCTPKGAINDRPFAAFTLERDTPRALGEAASLLVDPRRRVLHATWAQPVDEGGTVVTRIFHAEAKLNRPSR